MITGSQRDKQHLTKSGQDQQTLRRQQHTTMNAEYITDDVEEQQEARKARGLPAPQQPTAQERPEHELTHLPYRSWCPACAQAKGRSDNHPKQQTPVIQCDVTYYKASGEQATSSISQPLVPKQVCAWQHR